MSPPASHPRDRSLSSGRLRRDSMRSRFVNPSRPPTWNPTDPRPASVSCRMWRWPKMRSVALLTKLNCVGNSIGLTTDRCLTAQSRRAFRPVPSPSPTAELEKTPMSASRISKTKTTSKSIPRKRPWMRRMTLMNSKASVRQIWRQSGLLSLPNGHLMPDTQSKTPFFPGASRPIPMQGGHERIVG